MAAYETGYEDELFEHPVGHSLHCIICTNVIKDPVACRHNEHIFCRACITEHLKNHQTCPSCMDPLTVDALSLTPRTVTNLLAELKIRCEFFDRGCGKFIELGSLESHLRECGFAPAVCSNEGCQLEVNKQDLLHHETAVCEQRRVKCHSCNDIRREMDIVKVNLAAMYVKLDSNKEQVRKIEGKLEGNEQTVKAVVAKVELIQEQLTNQKVSIRHVQGDVVEVKKCLNQMTKQLERMTQQTSYKFQAEQEEMRKGIAQAIEVDREPKIIIAGGQNQGNVNSVEMFSILNGTWTMLNPMKDCRSMTSSVVHNNEILVVGGFNSNGGLKSIEKLSLNAVQNHTIVWQLFPAVLPQSFFGHCTAVYNGQLIVTGGVGAYSDNITELSLVPPYTSKLLTTMPQARRLHGIAIFGDKILILGGITGGPFLTNKIRSVSWYNITTNECQELAPLPYPVFQMATVKWDDDNVIIMGGADSNDEPLNTVLIYNVKTQKSHMLAEMKYKRGKCVAVVVRDTVIVMGGIDERGNFLKSVESFRFNRYTWEELPEMHEARYGATAVVCVL